MEEERGARMAMQKWRVIIISDLWLIRSWSKMCTHVQNRSHQKGQLAYDWWRPERNPFHARNIYIVTDCMVPHLYFLRTINLIRVWVLDSIKYYYFYNFILPLLLSPLTLRVSLFSSAAPTPPPITFCHIILLPSPINLVATFKGTPTGNRQLEPLSCWHICWNSRTSLQELNWIVQPLHIETIDKY